MEGRSLLANSISNLYTKRLFKKSYQEAIRYTSVALCAVGTSVTLHNLRPLRDSVCLLDKRLLVYHLYFGRTIKKWMRLI